MKRELSLSIEYDDEIEDIAPHLCPDFDEQNQETKDKVKAAATVLFPPGPKPNVSTVPTAIKNRKPPQRPRAEEEAQGQVKEERPSTRRAGSKPRRILVIFQ